MLMLVCTCFANTTEASLVENMPGMIRREGVPSQHVDVQSRNSPKAHRLEGLMKKTEDVAMDGGFLEGSSAGLLRRESSYQKRVKNRFKLPISPFLNLGLGSVLGLSSGVSFSLAFLMFCMFYNLIRDVYRIVKCCSWVCIIPLRMILRALSSDTVPLDEQQTHQPLEEA